MKKLRLIFTALIMMGIIPFLSSCEFITGGEEETTTESDEMEMTEEAELNGEPMMQVVIFENVDQQVRANVDELVTPYLELKDALVATNAEEAKSKAAALTEKAAEMKSEKLTSEQKQFLQEQLTAIQTEADKIANAADVEEQRNAFYPLSESIYKMVKAFGANDEQLFVQYCPMAFDNEGAWWISGNEEIRNPYFGDKMLKCGSVKEKIAVK